MKVLTASAWVASALVASVLALPARQMQPGGSPPVIDGRAGPPTVVLSANDTVVGLASGRVEKFAGIPFADPPTGPLRLRPPRKLSTSLGSAFQAIDPAPACPQMLVSTGENQNLFVQALGELVDLPIFKAATRQSEDCLTVSVIRPAGVTAGAKLPVLYWIFGGAFEIGWAAMYDGTDLLDQAIQQGQPFIFVAVNYRVAGFGFMPGREILADGSANLGLLDQRAGLEWVADNIEAFGGDPAKVTIWGESAGAISVFDQMALYGGDNKHNGKPLFRAAIMNSGSIVPADPVDCPKAQAVYDTVVHTAGCAAAPDTLECLRALPYDDFLHAANSVPGFLSHQTVALSYLPRPDGSVLPDSPDVLARTGRYAAVPMITGNQEDEGTIFALLTANLTTTQDLLAYLSTYFFNSASPAQLTALLDTYPPGPAEGSPFRTSLLNELYPQFKRVAAVLGDLVFTLSRRGFLADTAAAHPAVPSWSYLASYNYGTPLLGTFHGSDLLQVFFGVYDNHAARSIRTYYYNFLHSLDPNQGAPGYPPWPPWRDAHQLVRFHALSQDYLADDFRADSYQVIVDNIGSLRI